MDDNLSREEQRIMRTMNRKKSNTNKPNPAPTQSSSDVISPKSVSQTVTPTPKPVSETKNTSSTNSNNSTRHTLSEDEIAQRELAFEKERERLKKVEEDLIRNRKSVLEVNYTFSDRHSWTRYTEPITIHSSEGPRVEEQVVREPEVVINTPQPEKPPVQEKPTPEDTKVRKICHT